MKLEETIFRRMSIRDYTDEPISDEDLSTILYAGFGLREDGKHTVAGIDNVNAAVLYVIREDGAYRYNPENHSLILYKSDNWLKRVGWQYKTANILIGLCWKKNLADPNFAGVELGEIGQNIAFAANSLDIGTVVTGEVPPAIDRMGIPEDENGMIIMYMGHPEKPYNFAYRPWWLSLLPRIEKSSMSLSEAIDNRIESTSFSGEISRKESGQILWSSYGFSYNVDKSNQGHAQIKRHRTVPSGHGYYPLLIFAVTKHGIYRYHPSLLVNIYEAQVDFLGLPIISFLFPKRIGDKREIIAQASSMPSISSAPLSLIIVLDLELAKELSDPMFDRFWYFEAGAAAHNVMLESTALGLKHNIAYPIDESTISAQLKLNNEQIPMLILPIGK
jgi:nitroreductase